MKRPIVVRAGTHHSMHVADVRRAPEPNKTGWLASAAEGSIESNGNTVEEACDNLTAAFRREYL